MKNKWLIWVFIIGVGVTVLFAFNYRSARQNVPLSEIFKEEEVAPVDVEYEFVESDSVAPSAGAVSETAAVESQTKTLVEKIQTTEEKVKSVQGQSAAKAPAAQPASTLSSAQASAQKGEAIPFTIQISSFKEKDKADKILNELLVKKYPGFIITKDLGSKGTWHRVYVGKYNSKVEAEQTLTQIKKEYKDSFIITPK